MTSVERYLQNWVDLEKMQPNRSGLLSLNRFMLENGQQFKMAPITFLGPRMTPKECYVNATHMALGIESMIYCEGYVEVYGLPIQHAWCVNAEGEVIDPTLTEDPKDRLGEYFGIPFKTKFMRSAIIKNGYYGLLDYPLSKKTLLPMLEGKTKPKTFKAEVKNVVVENSEMRARSPG